MIVAAHLPETAVIAVENLHRVYRVGSVAVPALQGITLQIAGGQFVALKGRSGSGKTTLLNCLGGLDLPTAGTVHVLGQDLAKLPEEELTRWRREKVGFVFQSFGLLPTLSAYENVELVLRLTGTAPQARHTRTLTCLASVGISGWMHLRPYEMSGGQQQRVAIARALANQPCLILADEPTGELDSVTAREILALLRQIVDRDRVTLLMVSHDPVVDEYADQRLVLEDGLIIEAG